MKTILAILFISMLSTNLMSNEVKMTNEELIAKIMQLDIREQKADKKIAEAKAKTKALEKLEKKVDELSKILKVDK